MIYKCVMCDTVFTQKPLLYMHFDTHLAKQKVHVFKCPDCTKLYAQKGSMMEHIKVQQEPMDVILSNHYVSVCMKYRQCTLSPSPPRIQTAHRGLSVKQDAQSDSPAPALTPAPGPSGPGPELQTAASPSEPSSRDTVKHIAGGDKHQASERSSDSEAGAPSPGAPKGIHAPTADPLPLAQPARICSDSGREGGGGTAAQTPTPRSETLPGSGESGEEGPPVSDARGQDSDPGPKTDPCRAVSRTPGGEREHQGVGSLDSSESSQELTGSRDEGVEREETRKEEKAQDPLVKVSRLEKQVGLMDLFLPYFAHHPYRV